MEGKRKREKDGRRREKSLKNWEGNRWDYRNWGRLETCDQTASQREKESSEASGRTRLGGWKEANRPDNHDALRTSFLEQGRIRCRSLFTTPTRHPRCRLGAPPPHACEHMVAVEFASSTAAVTEHQTCLRSPSPVDPSPIQINEAAHTPSKSFPGVAVLESGASLQRCEMRSRLLTSHLHLVTSCRTSAMAWCLRCDSLCSFRLNIWLEGGWEERERESGYRGQERF